MAEKVIVWQRPIGSAAPNYAPFFAPKIEYKSHVSVKFSKKYTT